MLAVLGLRRVWDPAYRALVARSGTALAELSGPDHEVLWLRGQVLEIQRRTTIRQFGRGREPEVAAYPVLALWAWILIAPRTIRHRLSHAAAALPILALLQAVAVSCEALSAYRSSVAAMGVPVGESYRFGTAILGALGTGLTSAAAIVVPVLLAFLAYPGPKGPVPSAERPTGGS